MPKPNMMAIIEEPPYDIIGSGEPTIGSKPNTIIIFTATYTKKAAALFFSGSAVNKIAVSICSDCRK